MPKELPCLIILVLCGFNKHWGVWPTSPFDWADVFERAFSAFRQKPSAVTYLLPKRKGALKPPSPLPKPTAAHCLKYSFAFLHGYRPNCPQQHIHPGASFCRPPSLKQQLFWLLINFIRRRFHCQTSLVVISDSCGVSELPSQSCCSEGRSSPWVSRSHRFVWGTSRAWSQAVEAFYFGNCWLM